MALMKMGRSMPKGEDPKKPKSGSKVKVTNNKIDIEGAKSENIFYADIKDPVARKKAAVEYENKSYEKSLKSGNVPLSSLDPVSRKLWSSAIGKSSGAYGEVSDYSVSGPVKSYEDIYGKGSKFNPEEFQAASGSGNLDKYMANNPELSQSGIPRAKFGGIRYRSDADDKKEKEATVNKMRTELGDPDKMKLDKLPILKPGKIDSSGGNLVTRVSRSEPIEKSDWQDPSGGRVKSRFVKPKNVKVGEYIGQNIKYAAQKATGKNPILRPGVEKKKEALIQGREGREGKMAKAYFSQFEGNTYGDIAGTKEELGARGVLKRDKAEIKAGIKEARKAGDKEKVSVYRATKKDINAEMNQAKLAGKYIKKLGREYTGAVEGQEISNTGSIKKYTPSTMTGFTGSKQDVFNKDANFDKAIRKSTENATNKNTVANQEKSLSFSQRRAERKLKNK
jgi:hypothetical protein